MYEPKTFSLVAPGLMPIAELEVQLGAIGPLSRFLLTLFPPQSARPRIIRSYSACGPIQNHTMSDPCSTASARWCSPTRADQERPIFLSCNKGCQGFCCNS